MNSMAARSNGKVIRLSCSCRLCGVDFFEYLTDVINRDAAMGPKSTADTCRDLLPDKREKKQ